MFHIASDSRAGYGENQDAMVVLAHPKQPKLLLVAIADGQGGQAGGKEAAQRACEIIIAKATASHPLSLIWTHKWQQLLLKTDKAIRDIPEAGFTTLIAFAVKRRKLYGAASGDSALMAVTAKDVKVLTKGQQKNPPIGSGNAHAFGINSSLPVPWTLIAMTDGVWKFAGWDKIWDSALKSLHPKNMIDSIRCAATLPGGELQDDFTMVVIQPKRRS